MHIDLQRFCGNEFELREALRSPFRRGACVYATNGHVAVRVPRDELPDVAEHDKAPNIEKLFAYAVTDTQGATFIPLPMALPSKPCEMCNATGEVMEDGEMEQCLNCYGMKVAYQYQPVGDAGFNSEYIAWLHTLPNPTIATRGTVNAALIRFDGGEALLMPMRAK